MFILNCGFMTANKLFRIAIDNSRFIYVLWSWQYMIESFSFENLTIWLFWTLRLLSHTGLRCREFPSNETVMNPRNRHIFSWITTSWYDKMNSVINVLLGWGTFNWEFSVVCFSKIHISFHFFRPNRVHKLYLKFIE